MLALLATYSWQEVRHHAWRSATAVLAVMLGVALAFSVDRINASALDEFASAARSAGGQPDLELRAAQGALDEALYGHIAIDPQVAWASPVLELQTLLGPPQENQRVFAVPGTNTNVPLWILGSSLFGAQLAAMLGLPFAFASHFAPDALKRALEIYRERFEPSKQLDKPYVMVGCNVVAADTDQEAKRLYTSMQILLGNITRGGKGQLGPPVDDLSQLPPEDGMAASMRRYAFVGGPEKIKSDLESFAALTGADEIIISGTTYAHKARLHSYEIAAQAGKALGWM